MKIPKRTYTAEFKELAVKRVKDGQSPGAVAKELELVEQTLRNWVRAAEAGMHWCLDVQFNDDQSRVRSGYAAHNLAIVRHIVMNLLRLNTTRKASIKSKRMLAATVDEFRAELLGFMT